jgi:hypothetical protein
MGNSPQAVRTGFSLPQTFAQPVQVLHVEEHSFVFL